MSRLTDEATYCLMRCADDFDSFGEECKLYKVCFERKMYDKLKHYEDLEEAGRLIELPCKVGDTVYQFGTFRDGIEEHRIYEISIQEDCIELTSDPWGGVICEAHQIGKVVKSDYEVNGYFLKKDEAETAFEEWKDSIEK